MIAHRYLPPCELRHIHWVALLRHIGRMNGANHLQGEMLWQNPFCVRARTIPLSEISDVTENVWINIHPVTIHLRAPSEFGSRIVFMPKVRFFDFSSHPVVNELKGIAGAARPVSSQS